MNFIKNMNISKKLLILLGISLAGMLVLSINGINGIRTLKNKSVQTYETITVPLSYSANARGSFNLINVNLYDAIFADETRYDEFETSAWEQFYIFKESVSNYYELIHSYDEANWGDYDASLFAAEKADITLLYQNLDRVEALITEILYEAANGREEKALEMMTGEFLELSGLLLPVLRELTALNVDVSYIASEQAKELYSSKLRILLVVLAVAFVFLTLFSVLIILSIVKPVKEMVKVADSIAKGDLNFNLQYHGKDELGLLAERFREMSGVLYRLIEELNKTADEHDAGDIDARIHTELFEGAYKEMAGKINEMVNSYIFILNDVFDSFQGVAEGNFELLRLKATYPGKKYHAVKQTDALRENLISISGEIAFLAESAAHGNLDIRADIAQYKGDWQKILKGLNMLLDSFSEPIDDAVLNLKEIARGNLKVSMRQEYEGAFNDIGIALADTVNSLNNYISTISGTIGKVAGNDLTVYIKDDFKGDFIAIKTSINMVIEKFKTIVTEIGAAASQIDAGARQISESSIVLAQGVTEQAHSIDVFQGSIQKINEQTQLNAKIANQANTLSVVSKESAEKSSGEMQSMLEAMEGIKEASDNIAAIIKVIENIAFQTNLLAINASVEAAKAGAQGKGFAVVADEVRSLAAKSQEAVEESTVLIETAKKKVAVGTQKANETAEALHSVVKNISEVSVLMEQINEASSQQATALMEVRENLGQISDVVQNNSASSEESAAAAQQLSSQAEILVEATKAFKIQDR